MKRLCSTGLVVVLLCLTALNCKEGTHPLPVEEKEGMGPAWLRVVGWLFPLESGGREMYKAHLVFYPAPPVDSASTATRCCLGDPSHPFVGLRAGGGEFKRAGFTGHPGAVRDTRTALQTRTCGSRITELLFLKKLP
jgi:hypothetical protein